MPGATGGRSRQGHLAGAEVVAAYGAARARSVAGPTAACSRPVQDSAESDPAGAQLRRRDPSLVPVRGFSRCVAGLTVVTISPAGRPRPGGPAPTRRPAFSPAMPRAQTHDAVPGDPAMEGGLWMFRTAAARPTTGSVARARSRCSTAGQACQSCRARTFHRPASFAAGLQGTRGQRSPKAPLIVAGSRPPRRRSSRPVVGLGTRTKPQPSSRRRSRSGSGRPRGRRTRTDPVPRTRRTRPRDAAQCCTSSG